MNTTFLLMLIIPVVGAGLLLYAGRDFFAQNAKNPWLAKLYFFPLMAPGVVVLGFVFIISYSDAVIDTEIWSGVMTGKDRVHDTYQRSYSCNCRSVQTCSGSGQSRSCSTTQQCSTCWETRYTVEWSLKSNIGTFTVDKEDSSSRRVYQTPDPALYANAVIGEPVARRSAYTNYVQAVPDTLFRPSPKEVKERFAALIPPYPDNVFGLYRLNRFVQVGHSFPDQQQWNTDLSEMLKVLGPQKEVNAIVVIAKTMDSNYTYALRDAWEGANKNDVVLVIGSEDGVKINWVDVISWTRKEIFKIQLRDEVQAIGKIDRPVIMKALASQISTNFERRRMREFEYLKNEIDPPIWLLSLVTVLLIGGYGWAYYRLTLNPKRSLGRRRF